jgi:hypothetical protein
MLAITWASETSIGIKNNKTRENTSMKNNSVNKALTPCGMFFLKILMPLIFRAIGLPINEKIKARKRYSTRLEKFQANKTNAIKAPMRKMTFAFNFIQTKFKH